MNRGNGMLSKALAVVLLALGLAGAAEAQRPYRMNDRQVNNLIRRVENGADRFRVSVDTALDRSPLNGTRSEDEINGYIRDFEAATDQLRSRFNSRTSVAADVENVLQRASFINEFMARNSLGASTQSYWSQLRTDLNSLAAAYNVVWDWNRRVYSTTGSNYPTGSYQIPYRITDREVDMVIQRVEQNTDRFRSTLENALDRSRYNSTRSEDDINRFVRDFETATDQLRSRFNSRASVDADVEQVLERAASIDTFMRNNRLTNRAQNEWSVLRSDLTALADAYGVAWNWNRRNLPGDQTAGNFPGRVNAANRLTGTFRLDPSQSDNPSTVADNAVRNLPFNERQRVRDQILRRLESPEMLAIERNGNNVTIASSRAPQTTFVANAPESREQLPNGSYARVTAQLNGDRLVVSSAGDRATDFTVTFDPIRGGRELRVTRQIWNDRLGMNPVTVTTLYDRTADTAEWNVYTGSSVGYGQTGAYDNNNLPSGDFVIANNETVIATLDTDLSTRSVQPGERFTLTVQQPSQFAGAVIEGTVASTDRGGRVTGRSELSFDFDTIRLRDGRSYRFAGFVESVRTATGETVSVDNEGTVRDSNQTNKTVQRAAIGTAVGAIIGAIAGGGKGAAIGAVIGGGIGAGGAITSRGKDIRLERGQQLMIRTSTDTRIQ